MENDDEVFNNNINNEIKENYIKQLEEFANRLKNPNTVFIAWYEGAVIPIHNPRYYDGRKSIFLCKEFNKISSTIEIEKNKYNIDEEQFNQIESYTVSVFKKLIDITIRQDNEHYYGSSNNIDIKLGSVYIMLDLHNIKNEEDVEFIENYKENLEKIILRR